jgi:hypothetical protein
MRKIWVLGIGLTLLGSGFFLPDSAQAFTIAWHSVDCTQLVKGGTNLNQNEQAFVCAIALKEIMTKCVNKGGNADNSSSHIFELQAVKFKWTTADAKVKQKNGTTSLQVTITDDDIKLMVNEWNYEHPEAVVSLEGTCPNNNYAFKWAMTRADAIGVSVLRPTGGNSKFECTKKFYPATLDPRYATDPTGVDPDGDGQIEECIPIKEPFKSCQRSVSGLYFTDASGTVITDPQLARIQECILFRDVNKDANFSLASAGTYNPDVNHLYAPFNGVSDEGGIWLTNDSLTPGTLYTGTCHQHGYEKANNGAWTQTGPNSPSYDVVTGAPVAGTGDVQCTGGSQLLDGVYGDNIFP